MANQPTEQRAPDDEVNVPPRQSRRTRVWPVGRAGGADRIFIAPLSRNLKR
jgi:hypothetical protein